MRQILIIIAVILLGWCTYVLFVLQSELNQPDNILQYIPEDASQVLIIPDVASFAAHMSAHEGTSMLWPSDSIFTLAYDVCMNLDAAISGNKGKTSMALTWHTSSWLLTILPENSNQNSLNQLINTLKNSGVITNNHAIANNSGLLCISQNPELLVTDQPTLLSISKNFNSAYKKAGKNSDAVFLYQADSLAHWNSFDLVIHEKHLLLNGFQSGKVYNASASADTVDYSIPVMSEADSLRLYKGNWTQIQTETQEYWIQQNMDAERNSMLNETELNCNCSVQNGFEYWPKGSVMSYQVNGKRVVTLGSNGSASAMEALSNLADTSLAENIYGNRLLTLKAPLNLSLILGDKGKTIAEFTLVGKFFTAFSKDKETLAKLAREIQSNQILNSSPGALNPAEYLIQDGIWTAEGIGPYAFANDVFPAFSGIPLNWKSGKSIFSSLTAGAMNDSLLFVNAVIGLNGNFVPQAAENSGGAVWETPIDAELIYGPAVVTNHYTKEKELFIQDAANAIYLISSSGNILWKTAIDGPITSSIEQIDMFKNGKLQMVFGTDASVYCIDRNGRAVEGFPIRLKAKASSPLRIFDYDRDKNYRIIVGCEDGVIYNFNIEGKPTKGWQYQKNTSICSKINHLRFGNNDYLIVLSKNGQVQLLKRDGSVRDSYKNDLNLIPESAWMQEGSNLESSGWIISDSEGGLHALMFDGKISKLFATPEPQLFIETLPAPGDSAPDFIVWNGNTIKRINISSQTIWEFPCKTRPLTQRSDKSFLITFSDGFLTFIKTPDGQDISGFPKAGNKTGYMGLLDKSTTVFSITSSDKKLICRSLESGNP